MILNGSRRKFSKISFTKMIYKFTLYANFFSFTSDKECEIYSYHLPTTSLCYLYYSLVRSTYHSNWNLYCHCTGNVFQNHLRGFVQFPLWKSLERTQHSLILRDNTVNSFQIGKLVFLFTNGSLTNSFGNMLQLVSQRL